jgi:aminocarboxymuconate-semialdehyde decarboxylase
MQDVDTAIGELRRIRGAGLRGAMISDHVLDTSYDDPEYEPFWQACEELDALIFFHQGFDQRFRVGRYHLDNAIGNLTERALTFGTLVAGGVLDRHPRLKLLLAHAGGFAPLAAQRMDKAYGFFAEDSQPLVDWRTTPNLEPPTMRPPSDYLGSFWYDCCTFSEASLRFLIDSVGADRIVYGTDHPAPMVLTNGVRWIRGLASLTEEEKEAILVGNAGALLGS